VVGNGRSHSIAVVIPVYQGERTLPALVKELAGHIDPQTTPGGHTYRVAEVILVHDNGPDGSADVMRELAVQFPFVNTVWLSRNYGQHPATLAGMSSTGSDWIVTMDEDGQHDPAAIPDLLDVAISGQAQLVYAAPTNRAPHSPPRNAASAIAKWLAVNALTGGGLETFSSFRLMYGELGRGVAAYCGPDVYLDVALAWVIHRVATCPVQLRSEGDRASGYSLGRLVSHFWHLVLTSGTRPLRLISILGATLASSGFLLAVYIFIQRITNEITVQGWTSVILVLLVTSGAVLFSLGVIAEYVGVAVKMAMGKPLYLIISDPAHGPLGEGAVDLTVSDPKVAVHAVDDRRR
jgi:polyisoprenyl-phosphate glycosyltransferase